MKLCVARALGCVALVLAAVALAPVALAPAQTAAPTLGVLVSQVVALFPRVDGDVLEVQGETVTLSIGKRDGLVPGVELSLYREGRGLRHPRTGEVLGQQGVKRQDVLDGNGLAPVGERFKIENLLVVSYTRVEKKPYMDVRLFTFPGGSTLLTTALFLPPSIKAGAKGDFSAAGKPKESQTPGVVKSLLARLLTGELDAGTYSSGESQIPLKECVKFPYGVIGMDVAVAPRDSGPRMVVTDGERVYLYKIVEQKLEPEWTYQASARGRIFSVQLADLNGD